MNEFHGSGHSFVPRGNVVKPENGSSPSVATRKPLVLLPLWVSPALGIALAPAGAWETQQVSLPWIPLGGRSARSGRPTLLFRDIWNVVKTRRGLSNVWTARSERVEGAVLDDRQKAPGEKVDGEADQKKAAPSVRPIRASRVVRPRPVDARNPASAASAVESARAPLLMVKVEPAHSRPMRMDRKASGRN